MMKCEINCEHDALQNESVNKIDHCDQNMPTMISEHNVPNMSDSDHTSPDMNSEHDANIEQVTEEFTEGVVEVISATGWYVPTKICTLKQDMLLDTGSSYTIMDHGLFLKIPETERPKLQPIKLILRSASGEILKIHGL